MIHAASFPAAYRLGKPLRQARFFLQRAVYERRADGRQKPEAPLIISWLPTNLLKGLSLVNDLPLAKREKERPGT
ncbi:MAG: hypothetical protein JKX86_08585 [Verrucomicrobiales bacterium]|nr:hypothetical protein [Verrucomicrobiales bacterium]